MTFTTDRLFRLNVAGPTSRVVSLSSSRVDLENVSPRLVGRYIRRLVTFVARRALQVRSVPEVIKTKRGPKRCAVLHRVRLAYVTSSAGRELIVGLVCVTRITFGVLRHAGFQTLFVKAMAEITSWSALGHLGGVHLSFHLLRVHVIAV